MIFFRIASKSKRSRARVGLLTTPHGEVETPTLVPVATMASVRTLTSEEARATGSQILIANAFHLHLKPGENVVAAAGGLHAFMNWQGPLMTDSGGFQVFSLGFGKDLLVGKVCKHFTGPKKRAISGRAQPKSVKISHDGVCFRSPVDGKETFLGPRESIAIQEKLGADIMFAFDECTAPIASRAYVQKAMVRTHRWAKTCLDAKKGNQALFGIVQGSHYRSLREESARYINALGFDGFGIGGDLGPIEETTIKVIRWTLPHIDESKPRHLLGIGYLGDIESIVREGIDLFDCTVPTHYARHGVGFANEGKLDFTERKFLKDEAPIERSCACDVCKNYRRNYIAHLVRAKEISGLRLLSFHNLFFFNGFVEKIREKIKQGKL